MRLITRLPIKRKYEIGDTFHFPNIILKEYRDNTVQNAHSFIFCVAVLTNIDKVTIRDENDKIVSSELFTIEVEDKDVAINGITFTYTVDRKFMDTLPRWWSYRNIVE